MIYPINRLSRCTTAALLNENMALFMQKLPYHGTARFACGYGFRWYFTDGTYFSEVLLCKADASFDGYDDPKKAKPEVISYCTVLLTIHTR